MTALYLSRLQLNIRRRDAQRDLADCFDMHRRILSAFPDEPGVEAARERYGVLYRVEQVRDGVVVLVQSRFAPDWAQLPIDYLAGQPAMKRIDAVYDALQPGMELRFRLHANPTKRISERNTSEDARWHGKRIELRGEDDQLAWLRRKGETGGFGLVSVQAHAAVADVSTAPRAAVHGMRQGTGEMTFGSVVFDGRLRVTDRVRFRAALEDGLGSGKAYGFGLLSVAPSA